MNSVYFCYQDNIFLADVIGEENICRLEPLNAIIVGFMFFKEREIKISSL